MSSAATASGSGSNGHPGRLSLVREERAFAAGLRDRRDALPARTARAAENLEGLDERREVVHLDRAVTGAGALRTRAPSRRPRRCGRVPPARPPASGPPSGRPPASPPRRSAPARTANSTGRRTASRKSPTAPVPSSSAKKPRRSAASADRLAAGRDDASGSRPAGRSRAAPLRSTLTARPPRRGRDERCPARSRSRASASSGAATPMQFGPSSTASSVPAAPRSARRPPAPRHRLRSRGRAGRRRVRPDASDSSKAASTRSCPTRRAASSGRSGRSATLAKHGRPSTSSLVGCTPQAGIPDRTISSTIRPCRGEAPTTATDLGKRSARTRL